MDLKKDNWYFVYDGGEDARFVLDWMNKEFTKNGKFLGKEGYKYGVEKGREFSAVGEETHFKLLTPSEARAIIEQGQKPKRGDWVEVSQNNADWYKKRFIIEIEGAVEPFVCVNDVDEKNEKRFINGDKFYVVAWQFMRPIPQIEISVTINGKEASPKDIDEQTWINLRK